MIRSAPSFRIRLVVGLVVAVALPARAGVVGNWDFAAGWNPDTGLIPAGASIPGLSLSYLPKTPLYSLQPAQSQPNPPQLQFATTGSFGIASLGDGSGSVVMRMPDMRGYGLVTGLMATFPRMVNGEGVPTKLNRFTVVMDVLVPDSTMLQLPPYYLTMLQTRLGIDGSWFIDKRTGKTGVASSYGGGVTENTWHRLALVVNLANSGAVPQYLAYVNGVLAAELVPDLVPVDESPRNYQLVYGDPFTSPPIPPDLFTDGMFSIGSLNDSFPGLGTDSAFYLFNADRNNSIDGPDRGELGVLYVANLLFRDDPLTAQEVAALGGPAPGYIIPVPEPAGAGLGATAAALAALAGRRRSRRGFLRAAAAAGGTLAAHRRLVAGDTATLDAPPAAATPPAGPLADYVGAADPSTRWTRIAGGDLGAGRFLAAELVSQTWRGITWRHQLAVCLPQQPALERPPLVLWVDGGKTPEGAVQPPAKQLPILAAIADAAGVPAALVRQVPNQPLFDGRREDDLIAHTFEQFFRSGDPTWPLLLPMVKTVASALDAVTDLVADEWGLDIDGCIVTGASKRGWTSWLAAGVEPRVRGLVPMVIDMLDMPRHIQLQIDSFGKPSEAIHDYVSRDLHRRLDTPRGHELLDIVDPVHYAAGITQPKIVALGTNDKYWPLESLDIYRDRLRGPTWVSYTPNAGHDLPPLRVAPLVAALARHVAEVEPLPEIAWTCDVEARTCGLELAAPADEVLVWTADSETRDFRDAKWSARPAEVMAGRCREAIPRPDAGFRAALLECRYARRPLPIHLSGGPLVVAGG